MAIKVLFHSYGQGRHCPDGFGAALAFYLKYGEKIEYIPVVHQEPPPSFNSEDEVYIVDFSYPLIVIESIKQQVKKLTVLDHHKTAEAALGHLPYCHFDQNKSGAMLAWEHVHPDTAPPTLFRYIQDRDLWQKALPNSDAIAAALEATSKTFENWAPLAALSELDFIQKMSKKGTILLEKKRAQITTLMSAVCLLKIGEPHPDAVQPIHLVTGTEKEGYLTSDLCEAIMTAYDVNMAAYRYVRLLENGSEEHCWSLRGRGAADVARIAKSFGGGGHQHAAGFKLRFGPSE